MTNVEALIKVYKALGGAEADVAGMDENAELIMAIAGVVGLQPVTASTEGLAESYWGTAVADMQEDVAVADGAITGTLKYVATGSLVEVWDAHHFLALKFTDPNSADVVKVGILNPGALDEDMDAVIAVTATTKPLKVIVEKDGITKTQTFDLSGLTLAPQG